MNLLECLAEPFRCPLWRIGLIALTLLLALPLLAHATDTGPPGRFPAAGSSAPPSPAAGSPLTGFTVADLDEAIKEATADPQLPNEVGCFTMIRNGISAIEGDKQNASAIGLATGFVRLRRIARLKLEIANSDACLAVCGAAQVVVPVPLLGKLIPVPNICTLVK